MDAGGMLHLLDMGAPALLLSAGLAMGLLHAFEPDHVAAVMTQARAGKSRRRKAVVKGSLLGALWGLGHTSTILLVGLAVFVFSLSIPESAFSWFEALAATMLIALGGFALAGRAYRRVHTHPHIHDDGTVHTHPHDSKGEHTHSHKAYMIGCVHGLAGSGGIVAFGASFLGSADAILYLIAVFGIGSVASMALISGIVSVPLSMVGGIGRAARMVRFLAGAAGISIGALIMYGLATGRSPIGGA